ncbi:hypothetical protein BSU04_47045 [Caballeronia sordidicola]|uniref:Uncharacterized protein n=1 Tax=Caballeronia sordidicola TaxID=196367 RepID=A0A226WLB0_CABSO|nr:hypothetical protein BSU04_47045 [Caballeronia sordidicola]
MDETIVCAHGFCPDHTDLALHNLIAQILKDAQATDAAEVRKFRSQPSFGVSNEFKVIHPIV